MTRPLRMLRRGTSALLFAGLSALGAGCILFESIDDLPHKAAPDASDGETLEDSTVDGAETIDTLDSADSAPGDADAESPTCTAGSYDCLGNDLRKCGTTGAWEVVEACPAGTCDASLKRCTLCTPGEVTCSGPQLKKCNALGSKVEDLGAPCASGTICDPTAGGKCRACTSDAYFCEGSTLKKCSTDALSSSTIADCLTTELCTKSTTSCVAPTCGVGEKRCSGKIVQTCNAGRTGWDDSTACEVGCASAACLTVSEIGTGGATTCARLSDGTVRCWGVVNGDGSGLIRSSPVIVPGLVGVTQIALNEGHVCALLGGGTAKCWGINTYGQLGDGTTTDQLSPIPLGSLSGIAQIAVGGTGSCARLTDGSLRCLGQGYVVCDAAAPIGVHSTPIAISAASGATEIGLGGAHACVSVSGAFKCWGTNYRGQLGDGTTTDRFAPTTISGLVARPVLGHTSSCGLQGDGNLKCWGDNGYGQVGDGTVVERHTPVFVIGAVAEVALGMFAHTCARMTDGSMKCWGYNGRGQLGDATTTDSLVPKTVPSLSGVLQIALGDRHTCARLGPTTVKCWGANTEGQLGDGTLTDRLSPTLVKW